MGKFIDLTGQVFERWTVLKQSEKRNNCGQIYWVYQCQCGTIKEVSGATLRNGRSKSCGCLQKEIAAKRFIKQNKNKSLDLTNQQFGRLTALYPIEEHSGSHIIWHCKCKCGNECNVRGTDLKNGNTKSCGCLIQENMIKLGKQSKIDLIGQKFGKLIVLYELEQRNNNGEIMWHCKCDCGNECDVRGTSLRNNHTQSCGCIKSQGEFKIAQILNENNILFKKEKSFNDCRFKDTNTLAKFDFYINNKYIIEYDGIQHFEKTGFNHDNLEKRQEHDEFKNQYCKKHNIPLIRIPYTHYENICLEDLLLETSKFLLKGET